MKGLYLGGCKGLDCEEELVKRGITHVVTVSSAFPPKFPHVNTQSLNELAY
jgi:hypothetical protein